jgi:tetratricopeptide (TPR) repeat protein
MCLLTPRGKKTTKEFGGIVGIGIDVPIFEALKDIFKDPIIYGPLFICIIFLLFALWLKWPKRILLILGAAIVLYTIVMIIYSNHNFVRTFSKMSFKKQGRANIAVLCFYNVTGDKNDNKDCNEFRYRLIRNLQTVSGKHELDVIDHNQIIQEPKLSGNACLTREQAIQIGKKFTADYSIYGEISPLKDILITLRVVRTDVRESALEIEIRRRITDIPSLSLLASKEILFNLKEIQESEKKKVRDELSSRKTTMKSSRYFSEGLDSFLRKQFSESIQPLKKAIEEDKTFPDPHYLLAFIYFHQQQDQLAIEELIETIKLDQTWAEPHYFLGVIHKKNGRYLEAKVNYEKALQLEDRLVYKMMYKTALSGALLKLNRVEEAKKIISEIEETHTKNSKVLYNLAARYCELSNLDKALALIKEAKDSGLSEYDCNAASNDPDFNNFRKDITKYKQFQELLHNCM